MLRYGRRLRTRRAMGRSLPPCLTWFRRTLNWPKPSRTRRVSLFESFAPLSGGGASILAAWFRCLFVCRFVRSQGWSSSVSSDAGCPCRSHGTRASPPFPAPARLVTPGLATARRSGAIALALPCTRRRGSSCRECTHSAAARLQCRSRVLRTRGLPGKFPDGVADSDCLGFLSRAKDYGSW